MKKLAIFTTILLSIVLIMTSVHAAESFSITAKMEKNEFSKNEEFTVEFNLSSMQVGEGIITVGATLEYDKESLEIIDKAGQNGWNMTYNDAEGIILLDNEKLIKDNGTLFKVTFKVKENSKQNLTIKLKDITAAGAGDEITAVNVEKPIVIKVDSGNNGGNGSGDNGGNNSGNNGGNNSGNSGNNNGNSNNNGNNNNGGSSNNDNGNNNGSTIINPGDNSQSGSTTNGNNNNATQMPKTGQNDTILFVLIGIAIISAIVFFYKSKHCK